MGEKKEWVQGAPSVAFVPSVLEEELSHWGQEEQEAQQDLVPLEVEGDWKGQQEENHQQASSLVWVERGLDQREQSHQGLGGLLALWPQPFGASPIVPTQ